MRAAIACLITTSLVAQTATTMSSEKSSVWEMPRKGSAVTLYQRPELLQVKLDDSPRLQSLMRDGKLYLSLRDAILLALENNLDLELERYGIRLADTDVLRSKAGAIPRGVPLSVRESPAGLGGPAISPNGTLSGGDTPALNSLIGPGVQVDLSILGSVPLATGPATPVFDPQIVGTVSGGHTSDIQNSVFLPGLRSLNSNTVTANASYVQGFSTGGNLNVYFNNSRLDQNSPLYLYNPSTQSTVGISFSQPLLRGFGFAANRRYIRIARNNRRVSNAVFMQQLIATVSGVVRLYWDLLSLAGDVRVREQAVSSSEQFLRDTRSQLAAETAAEVDVTRAQAELSRRQRDLAVARSLVRQEEIVLRDYISRGSAQGLAANAAIVATDTLPEPSPTPETSSLDALYALALKNRPEAFQVKLQMENADLSLQGSRNGVRPELNLVGTAENRGFGGRPFAGTPGDALLGGGYGDALSQVFHNNFPTYAIGVELALPLRNAAARSDVLRDEITVRQQQIRVRQLEKQIRLEITNASIAVDQARQTWEATRSERIAQEQTLSAEQQRLEVGASTGYLVIQNQRDLAAARSAEISALASYQKAKTALQRATGSILGDYNIVLDQALHTQ